MTESTDQTTYVENPEKDIEPLCTTSSHAKKAAPASLQGQRRTVERNQDQHKCPRFYNRQHFNTRGQTHQTILCGSEMTKGPGDT